MERNNSDYHFITTGTYYVVGRGKKDAGSPYAYTDETGWTNDIELTSANATTITVSFAKPSNIAAANTDYQSTDLSWTNQTVGMVLIRHCGKKNIYFKVQTDR